MEKKGLLFFSAISTLAQPQARRAEHERPSFTCVVVFMSCHELLMRVRQAGKAQSYCNGESDEGNRSKTSKVVTYRVNELDLGSDIS